MKKTRTITKEASVTTKNISMVFFLRIAQYPMLALFVMLIPRMMGPEIYGKYALLISIITITVSLISLGAIEIFGRFIPEFENRGEFLKIIKLFSGMIVFKGFISTIASLVIFFILLWLYSDQFTIGFFLIISLIVVIRDIQGVPITLLFGLNKLGKFALRDPIRRSLNLVLIIVLYHYYGLIGAIVSTLLVDLFLAILAFIWTKKYLSFKPFQIDLSFLRPFIRYGFLFYLSWVFINVWQRLGDPMIGFFSKSSQEIALFDIPNQIYIVMLSSICLLIGSFAPIFTNFLVTEKEGKIADWSEKIIKYTGILSSLIFWGFTNLGHDLIPIIIGREYVGIYPNGVILLLGLFPMIIGQLGYVFSIIYKKPTKYLKALSYTCGSFVIASLLLIPKFDSMGCSIATLISCIIYVVVLCIFYKEKLIPILPTSFKIIGFGLIFFPFTFLKGTMLTNICLYVGSTASYMLLLFAIKLITFDEINEIIHAIRHKPEKFQENVV